MVWPPTILDIAAILHFCSFCRFLILLESCPNFSDLTCLFNNGLSLVTSKESLIKLLNLGHS